MPILSKAMIQRHWDRGDHAATMHDRGRALEDLVCYVFNKVPGIKVTKRDQLNAFASEEIDVAFWNDRHPRGFPFLPYIVLVECKNWSQPVGAEEVSWFDTKLRNRGLTFGMLLAANGITGEPDKKTHAHQIICGALAQGRQIVIFERAEIVRLRDTNELVVRIKEKLCELAVSGTVIP